MVKYSVEDVIIAGRELYHKKGDDFTMRDVAKKLGTGASTLYRHVNNKRELYFAILTQEFDRFEIQINQLIAQLNQPTPSAVLKAIGGYILQISRDDYARFKLMFLTEPPEETKPMGNFEQTCNPKTIDNIMQMVNGIITQHNISGVNPVHLGYSLMALVLGAGFLISPYYRNYLNAGYLESDGEYEEFHNFVIEHSLDFIKNRSQTQD